MADEQKKYVDLEALKRYDELLKNYIAETLEWGQLGEIDEKNKEGNK